MENKFVCRECGSQNVQALWWVNVNTFRPADDNVLIEDGYCLDCDENCLIVTEEEYNKIPKDDKYSEEEEED